MPCSFCRSHEHNIRFCNSPEVQNITSRLAQQANIHSARFDYSGYLTLVCRMPLVELKIAALFWHTSMSPEEYHNLIINDAPLLPAIECNYTRDKYLYIVLWLYLDYAFSNCHPDSFTRRANMQQIGNFIERLEYLRRIVIDGMTNVESTRLYINNIMMQRGEFRYYNYFNNYQYESSVYDLSAVFGSVVANNNVNIKFEFNIEEVGNSIDFAKIPVADCPICYETLTKSCVELGCTHITCGGCFILYLKSRKIHEINCSLCRADILTVKTYDKELIPDLECYTNNAYPEIQMPLDQQQLPDADPEIQMPVPAAALPHYVPEIFDEGDNVVINFV
jgi:hypothetical protein